MFNIGDIVKTTYYGDCRIVSKTGSGKYVLRSIEITAPNGRFNTVDYKEILSAISKV